MMTIKRTGGDYIVPKPIFFLHIPKTAGTSVTELVERNFEPDACRRITDIHKPIDQIREDIEIALLEGAEFISGHVSFDAIVPFVNDLQIMTLLRNPLERIISVYRFWNTQSNNGKRSVAERLAIEYAKSNTFSAFIRCRHPVITSSTRNEQCHTIAGQQGALLPDRLFLRALTNIEKMSFGIVEKLASSLQVMSSELRINIQGMTTLNATPPTIVKPNLLDEDLLELFANNGDDLTLYRQGAVLLEDKVADLGIQRIFRELGSLALTDIGEAKRDGSFVWTPQMRLTGNNWHEREKLDNKLYYRFTTTPQSTIYFPNPFRSSTALIVSMLFFTEAGRIATRGSVSPADLLRFRIGSKPCEAEVVEGAGGSTDYVLRFSSNDDILKLAIQSDYGIEPSVLGSQDRRNLAAAISAITFKRLE
jgi:hypothetical protein